MMKGPLDYMLTKFGREVTLGRPGSAVTAPVRAKIRAVRPEEMVGGVRQDEMRIVCQAPDESVWTLGLLRNGDTIAAPEAIYAIESSYPMYEGNVLVGYRLHARG